MTDLVLPVTELAEKLRADAKELSTSDKLADRVLADSADLWAERIEASLKAHPVVPVAALLDDVPPEMDYKGREGLKRCSWCGLWSIDGLRHQGIQKLGRSKLTPCPVGQAVAAAEEAG